MKLRPVTVAFLSGVWGNAAFTGLRQDYYGKEGYIDHVRAHWVDASITVPLALFVCLASLFAYTWAGVASDEERRR